MFYLQDLSDSLCNNLQQTVHPTVKSPTITVRLGVKLSTQLGFCTVKKLRRRVMPSRFSLLFSCEYGMGTKCNRTSFDAQESWNDVSLKLMKFYAHIDSL